MTGALLSADDLAQRFRTLQGDIASNSGANAIMAIRAHVESLHDENRSLRADVDNLRDTLAAVTGGWVPPTEVELVVTFRSGRVEVCTDRSVPVLVSSAYPIVEG